jgi:hypothetical protein
MKTMNQPLLRLLCCGAAVLALQGCTTSPAGSMGNAASSTGAPSMGMGAPASGAQSTALQVTGAVDRPLRLDLAALQAQPPTQVTANSRTYTGASVWALLNQAGIKGVAANPSATGAMYLVATGSDGFKAVLSLGEIDPSYGNRQAIVAYSVDGAGLGANGFARLIVGGDSKMSRAVSRLASIEMMAAPTTR